MSHYIYTLRLIPKYWDVTKWTNKESHIVTEHFRKLQEMLKDGRLILAGKTDDEGEEAFGIVIFNAESDDEANEIMNNDPAVKKGLMTATLKKYSVALISEKNV